MRKRVRLFFGGVGAVLLLCALTATASANRLRLSSTSFRSVANELRFAAGFETRCPFTLEGTFHRASFTKVEQALLGYVTRARINEAACQEGTATVLQERLPWHVTYERFTGTLPTITSVAVQIHGASLSVTKAGMTCLVRSSEARPWLVILEREAGGVISEAVFSPLPPLPKIAGSVFCPAEIAVSGIATYTVLGAATMISVSLI
jgi:hypothetical protein